MPRFEASALRGYCVSVLTASGVERSCAEAVADALIDAELTGVSTHGVSRLAVYMQRMDAGVMSRENNIRIVRESTSTLVVDAGNSLGAAAAKFAMERCIAKAKETGCCFASVHSSNHFGTAAYYTRLAAAQDMIGFACTNLKGKIAPFGSAEPYMGTNPISVAAPSDDLPVVLDMAPSVVALGKLILAQKLGKSIPEGWALDKDGRPTTDPAAGRAGSLVPIGGAKGSGLAIMVDVLCRIIPTRMGTRLDLLRPKLTYWDHPHAYGDKRTIYSGSHDKRGSSPRVWGQELSPSLSECTSGIIPTRMGTREKHWLNSMKHRDHPHAYGDKCLKCRREVIQLGSSPRVWGQVLISLDISGSLRIIPTRMGTSRFASKRDTQGEDHPHAYGDKAYSIVTMLLS